MVYLAVMIGVLVVALILSPFWVGPGGRLAAAASVSSPERLESMKSAILKRYLEDENAYKVAALSKRAWEKRRSFLVNRYVDVARRLDFVAATERGEDPQTRQQEGNG